MEAESSINYNVPEDKTLQNEHKTAESVYKAIKNEKICQLIQILKKKYQKL